MTIAPSRDKIQDTSKVVHVLIIPPEMDRETSSSRPEASLKAPDFVPQGTLTFPIPDCRNRRQSSSAGVNTLTAASSDSQKEDPWARKSLLSLGMSGTDF